MLFLGVFNSSSSSYSDKEISELRKAISRDPDAQVETVKCAGFVLVTVNDETFGRSTNLRISESSIGLMLGRPYLETLVDSDVDALFNSLLSEDRNYEQLANSRGSFCSVVFDRERSVLRLCTDKVGVYPVYIARVGDRIYFSSALRMLQSIEGVCGALDLEGVFCKIAYGYSLGTQTTYVNVERMYGGEVNEFSVDGVDRSRYWSWDDVNPLDVDYSVLKTQLFNAFIEAVGLRIEGSAGDLSFLSGGLDSRCIVGALTVLNRPVWSLNFAPQGCQDQLFGEIVAKALGAKHFQTSQANGSLPERQKGILERWAEQNSQVISTGLNPFRVWSGDGGSVGLGHVYLDRQFINLLRNDRLEEAVQYFLDKEKIAFPSRMLVNSYRKQSDIAPKANLMSELESFKCVDRGKAGFLFLLMNDQRQHLSNYFEDLDIHRFEMVLPFFDAKFLELIVAAPLDLFLSHVFYNDWLSCFPDGVGQVPWQAYPTHEPCPLPMNQYKELRYQWTDDWFDEADKKARRNKSMKIWRGLIFKRRFSRHLVRLEVLVIAYLLTRLGVSNYDYLLNAAVEIDAMMPD
jgi:hypothetical protein